ncbi:GNAT family N-acetyltransferase [Streptococcus sp.]|mgnify:FL=1|jgi:ribosomal protein S18 acetylase RimI-like enzyme|uniref:GNAT family N-acetyltransferase n=1 Tax=Streptococcus sp. TaxID=1306 RepID=UPI00391A6FE9
MSSVKIRSQEPKDGPAIFQLYSQQGWDSFSQELLEQLLTASHWLILEQEGQFIGSVRYLTDGLRTIYLCELLVKAEYRCQGYGSLLMAELQRLYPSLRIDLISDADAFYDSLQMRRRGMGYRSKTES